MRQRTLTLAELRRTLRESPLERMFAAQVEAAGLPTPEREYRFAPPRRWRFDFCFVAQKLAVECEGGVYSRGRHVRGDGFQADAEKYLAATVQGWRVLRVTARQIEDGTAIEAVTQMMGHDAPECYANETHNLRRQLAQRDNRIAELEAEVERLKAGGDGR